MIVEPPDARTVARRAAALFVFTYRMTYERSWSTRTKAQRAEDKEDLEEMGEFSRWAALEEFSSRREADPIRKEVGTWPETEIKQGSWAGENLLMLLWALRRVEPLPPIWKDSLAVHAFLNDEVEGWPEFVDRANLRPAEKIDLMYSYVSCVRLRERTPDTFEGVPWLAEKALSFGGEPPLEGDLPIDGTSYSLVKPKKKGLVRSLALERYRALRWLVGEESDLDAPDLEPG